MDRDIRASKAVAGPVEVIDALIVAAKMTGVWPERSGKVMVVPWQDIKTVYRLEAISVQGMWWWRDFIELSRNFEVRYVQ